MKKILLASTALVAFAGAAAANDNISLSGSAKMAVVGGDRDITLKGVDTAGDKVSLSASEDSPTQFFQDVDVTFAMSSETDGGLVFGTAVDLDEATKLGSPFSNQGVAVYVKGDFGTVTLGDTDSAMDAVLLDGDELAGGLGSINDANTSHLGFNGDYLVSNDGDGQRLAYAYSYEGFTGVVSFEQVPSGANGQVLDGDDDMTWSVGIGYDYDFGSGSAIFGLGYTWSDDGAIQFGDDSAEQVSVFTGQDDIAIYALSGESNAWGLSAAVEMENGFSGGVTYVQYDFSDYKDGDLTYWGVGGAYTWEEFAIGINYGQYENDNVDQTGWGLAMAYDLGGGLEVQAGYGSSSSKLSGLGLDIDTDDDGVSEGTLNKVDFDSNVWSLGLAMSF